MNLKFLSKLTKRTHLSKISNLFVNNFIFKFSRYDEMAFYDIPASMDYVLDLTGETSVYYVGFSMGTTSFFAFLSEKPEYNDKVNLKICISTQLLFELFLF